MIERLDIWNLKSFSDEHSIELAPITLVYGPNSAGKSTLLQSLALLKQTLEPLGSRVDLATPPLALRGELVDLGSFGSVVHRHERDRPLGVGVRFRDRQERGSQRRLIRGLSRGASAYGALQFGYDSHRKAPVQRLAAVGIDDDVCWFGSARAPKSRSGEPPRFESETWFTLRDEASEDAYCNLIRSRLANARSDSEYSAAAEQLLDVLGMRFASDDDALRFRGRGFFPFMPDLGDLRDFAAKHGRTETGERILFGGPMNMNLNETLRGAVYGFEELLNRMAYLGPLRAAPTRFQQLSSELHTNVGASGEFAPMLLARDSRLVAEVNEWLARLHMRYELSVDTVTSEQVGLELGDLLATTLRDTRNGIAVTPQDVGFGVSQLLPVVVQLLSGKRRTVLIEQPEIHIHPRLQAEVADLLIEAASPARGNQVIVETHSEHLMLRLQRRLQQSDDWLTADKVAVIYVDADEQGRAVPMRLRLDDDGRFLDEWPGGFFAERLNELFTTRRSRRPGSSDTS